MLQKAVDNVKNEPKRLLKTPPGLVRNCEFFENWENHWRSLESLSYPVKDLESLICPVKHLNPLASVRVKKFLMKNYFQWVFTFDFFLLRKTLFRSCGGHLLVVFKLMKNFNNC